MDAKSTFLHGKFHDEIFMEQPLGFIQNYSILVFSHKKSIYGLKQAPYAWYSKMDSFLLDTFFFKCHFDDNFYAKIVDEHLIILVLYVNDRVLASSDPNLIAHVNYSLKKKFDMTYLGYLDSFCWQ